MVNSKIYLKNTDLVTFDERLLENKHVPYEGLVMETSNAQHGMFSFKNPTIVTKHKYFEAKCTKTPIFTWIIVKFR